MLGCGQTVCTNNGDEAVFHTCRYSGFCNGDRANCTCQPGGQCDFEQMGQPNINVYPNDKPPLLQENVQACYPPDPTATNCGQNKAPVGPCGGADFVSPGAQVASDQLKKTFTQTSFAYVGV